MTGNTPNSRRSRLPAPKLGLTRRRCRRRRSISSSRDLADLDGLFPYLSQPPQGRHRHIGGVPTDRDRDQGGTHRLDCRIDVVPCPAEVDLRDTMKIGSTSWSTSATSCGSPASRGSSPKIRISWRSRPGGSSRSARRSRSCHEFGSTGPVRALDRAARATEISWPGGRERRGMHCGSGPTRRPASAPAVDRPWPQETRQQD